jgi:hypothetical protein
MYTYFAHGNLDGIGQKICPGLLNSLRRRAADRAPGTYLKWICHDHLSKPRIASVRCIFLQQGRPKEDQHGVAQVVVRLHTLQSLQRVKKVTVKDKNGIKVQREVAVDYTGKEIPNAPPPDNAYEARKSAKESVEFFVMQSVMRNSKMGPWLGWGMAEEMTMEKLKKQEAKDK